MGIQFTPSHISSINPGVNKKSTGTSPTITAQESEKVCYTSLSKQQNKDNIVKDKLITNSSLSNSTNITEEKSRQKGNQNALPIPDKISSINQGSALLNSASPKNITTCSSAI